MNTLIEIGSFFLSEWLWGITWGIYAIPIAMINMFILMRFYTRASFGTTLLVALSGPLIAFLVFNIVTLTVLIYGLGFEYAQTDQKSCEHIFLIYLWLGLIYGSLQSIYLKILSIYYPQISNVQRLYILSYIAHIIAAWMSYLLLPFCNL
ncbi:MAG TPA: hypothetical protein VGT41_01605 [Candidatus Babeliales bacterium]|nr:hypothetical protein [Candidatus Babeliales bacterium]